MTPTESFAPFLQRLAAADLICEQQAARGLAPAGCPSMAGMGANGNVGKLRCWQVSGK